MTWQAGDSSRELPGYEIIVRDISERNPGEPAGRPDLPVITERAVLR